MEVFLALPQDVHDRIFKGFTTTREGEERRGSRGSTVCVGSYSLDQLFDVEHLVHRESVAARMMAVFGERLVRARARGGRLTNRKNERGQKRERLSGESDLIACKTRRRYSERKNPNDEESRNLK